MEYSRFEKLAELFERASKRPTNIIDPPFECVTLNLEPVTCSEIARYFRAMQTLAEQAKKPFTG